MCYLQLTCAIVCDCMSSICSDPHVRWMQIRGNAMLCYVAVWRHCVYVVSGMTFPSAPVSCLHISWFVQCGDWHFSCTSACVPSVLQTVSSVFTSSWSKYSSFWLSVSFEFSKTCMPCFFDITGRVGRFGLVSLAFLLYQLPHLATVFRLFGYV